VRCAIEVLENLQVSRVEQGTARILLGRAVSLQKKIASGAASRCACPRRSRAGAGRAWARDFGRRASRLSAGTAVVIQAGPKYLKWRCFVIVPVHA
jgi:hypothetical protein